MRLILSLLVLIKQKWIAHVRRLVDDCWNCRLFTFFYSVYLDCYHTKHELGHFSPPSFAIKKWTQESTAAALEGRPRDRQIRYLVELVPPPFPVIFPLSTPAFKWPATNTPLGVRPTIRPSPPPSQRSLSSPLGRSSSSADRKSPSTMLTSVSTPTQLSLASLGTRLSPSAPTPLLWRRRRLRVSTTWRLWQVVLES